MEDRKRTAEYAGLDDPFKRNRPDELISRILVTKMDMGKIIGKSGATISEIRNKSGANLKAVDIDEFNRMVLSFLLRLK
jgi:predicted PilT family ATPase